MQIIIIIFTRNTTAMSAFPPPRPGRRIVYLGKRVTWKRVCMRSEAQPACINMARCVPLSGRPCKASSVYKENP